MKRMGVFATDEAHDRIMGAARMPVLLVGGVAPRSAAAVAHDEAVRAGLSDYAGMYGYDPSNREYLGADNAPDFIPPAPAVLLPPLEDDPRDRTAPHGDPMRGAA